MVLEFYGKHAQMTCLGNKGLLMSSLRSRQINRLVSYVVSSKEWLKVPGCTLPRVRKGQWIACGAAFHPCLTASLDLEIVFSLQEEPTSVTVLAIAVSFLPILSLQPSFLCYD
ncbi:F-box only protein 6 [Camellia lanceoleosa]|uniref:F-box only protein 6 n=1 Tax=Camellia lanceoleosa TaxID=1840588 RepID=A0ACC0G5Q1_9ERIC|nr:F-box only protein 6 [Camellia lanceoleosa]